MNHIEQTIADISARIASLEKVRNGLEYFLGLTPPAPVPTPAPAPWKEIKPAKLRRTASGPRSQHPAPTAIAPAKSAKPRRGRTNPVLVAAIQTAAKLHEPFTTPQLALHLETDLKSASNFITRWKLKGWLTRTGPGQYTRTKQFGGGQTHDVHAANQSMLSQIHSEIAAAKTSAD